MVKLSFHEGFVASDPGRDGEIRNYSSMEDAILKDDDVIRYANFNETSINKGQPCPTSSGARMPHAV